MRRRWTRTNPELLSVVVPAHNEARGIAHAVDVMLRTLASCGMDLEIIVVDDGSRDETFDRVRDLSQEDARDQGAPLHPQFRQGGGTARGSASRAAATPWSRSIRTCSILRR